MTAGPQHGLLAHPPQHLLIAALAFTTPTDTAANQVSLTELREVLRLELAGDLDEIVETTPKDSPTPETGEVGVADGWEQTNLTIDVGFSASGYAALGYTAGALPADLIEVPWTRLGPLMPANPVSGDFALHIRADNVFAVEHVLRRVEHSLTGKISTLWTLGGTQRYAPSGNLRDQGRALIGFHDGLSNLDPSSEADRQLIFVDPAAVPGYPANPPPTPAPGNPGYGGQPPTPTEPSFPTDLRQPPTTEPSWTTSGSYMFVRGSVLNTASWDSQILRTQEAAVGRFKSSGSFLDQKDTAANKNNPPAFAGDQTSIAVPPTSHSRRANPRSSPTDPQRRVLRRGYPLLQTGAGTIKRGLTLITFSRSLTTQIEFVMAAWLENVNFPQQGSGRDPLLAYETEVLAGGYYFVPVLADQDDPTSWIMPS